MRALEPSARPLLYTSSRSELAFFSRSLTGCFIAILIATWLVGHSSAPSAAKMMRALEPSARPFLYTSSKSELAFFSRSLTGCFIAILIATRLVGHSSAPSAAKVEHSEHMLEFPKGFNYAMARTFLE
ncbi:hypothetical protein PCANC_14317 [Puccinia coronata f. sp. avenae]|uniref:Uncharacterized protein n=1 Tax=Puccinia coronata f. sp. avenae TaxID=200324 RepID=A0A2N5S2U0_9BASI|nr:hypothetical protein PCASD_23984 [Puccinia coronata f. sp. avenae]PLW38117.1 hypothetical protein PCASD_11781 [Puccinia coronata f. sp. avenae]PLW50792.1 hypothetical protein PCANC_14317 [Puccinia coronata f. sp. avenae]